MFRLSCLLTLFSTSLFLASCTEETDPDLPVSGIDVEQLVEAYNSELDPSAGDEQEAFVATGTVTDADVVPHADGEALLTFTFADREARHTFNFYLDEEVAFPEEIDRAKVVFLGHQMIVADLDGEFFVHLLASDRAEENLLPNLPFVEGSELAMESRGDLFSAQ